MRRPFLPVHALLACCRTASARALPLLLILTLPLLDFGAAVADGLKDIRELANKRTERHQLTSPHWIPPGSVYWFLYNDKTFLLDLPAYLMPELKGYPASDPVTLHNSMEYRGAAANYTTPRLTRVRMTILIPHPKLLDAAASWLVDEFTKFKPPSSSVVDSYDLSLPGAADAKFYLTTPEGCRALIHAEKGSLIALVADDCRRPSDVAEMAKLLTIEKFNEKLKDNE